MSSLKPLPYYKWFWQDFRASRTVQRMTYTQRGLYRDLLDECWAEGSIPCDVESMAEICGCPVEVMADAWQVLSRCFTKKGGSLVNIRLDSERTEKDSQRVNRIESGKLGGLAKLAKTNTIMADAKQLLSSCHIGEKRREEESKEEESKEEKRKATSRARKSTRKKGNTYLEPTPIPDALVPVAEFLCSSWPKTSLDKDGTRTLHRYSIPDLWNRIVYLASKLGKDPGSLLFTGVPYLRGKIKDAEDTGIYKYIKDMSNFWGIKEETRAWDLYYEDAKIRYAEYMAKREQN